MPDDLFDKAIALLRKAGNTVALTGAGASTESSIPDFRGKNGLWSRYDPIEYGTLGAFKADPVKVWQMLAGLLDIVDTKPNKGHKGLAVLEQLGLLNGIITQNIDGLHRKGGSRNIIEFHGGLDTFSCLACGAGYDLGFVQAGKLPPHCQSCGAILKPDIIFFDELISDTVLNRTEEMLASVDLLLVAGTSCQVQPAARIPFIVYNRGGKIIEINREPVLQDIAAVTLKGSFATIMEKLVGRLTQEASSHP
jgi:NAD-dependent protein deacetylase/lipoamidase